MRSARCSTRCAQRPTLPPTSWIVLGVAFVIGVLLLGIGTAIYRTAREDGHRSRELSWTKLVDESLTGADVQLRLDMIERLRIVDNEWSRGVLERAREEDPNESVRSAANIPARDL